MKKHYLALFRKIFTTTTLLLIIAALSGALVLKASAYYNVDWNRSTVPIE
jgi:hypothetical protein